MMCAADDYSAFSKVWKEPAGGLHGYLVRFLENQDSTFQHIAVWTIVQLLESGDMKLEASIKESSQIMAIVNSLSSHGTSTAASSQAGDGPAPSDSVSQQASDDEDDEGDSEITLLARKVLEMLA